MRLLKSGQLFLAIISLLILSAGLPSFIYSQEVQNVTTIEATIKPVPNVNVKSVDQPDQIMENPDTNFAYEKYAEFLMKVSDTSKYLVLPIDEFRKKTDPGKIVIGLRHDVDNDLMAAKRFSQTEKNLGFRSTYYILHTADYYLANPNNKGVHTDSILPVLKEMQNNSNFEIGWHNDLVTLQVVYKIDPVNFLHQELAWLRSNGLKITGSASHGSNYCRVYNYLNFYFFEECTWPIVGQFVNNVEIPDGSTKTILKKGRFSDFGLEYEAYFLNNNKYYSDASYVNGERWSIGKLDLNSLNKGDRVIILLHPIHWHPGSTLADIRSFFIPDQKSVYINPQTSTVSVVMPYGTNLKDIIPIFSLSPGAYARVLSSMQTSGKSVIDASKPVIYRVYAENRNITKDWTVKITNAKNSAASFESFFFPGQTKRVIVDPVRRTINARVYSTALLGSLTPEFRLSPGAGAYIGTTTQLSNSTSNDFSNPVYYKIVAEDGVTASQWQVTVEILNNRAEFLSFVIPGMTRPASIDEVVKSIKAEVAVGESLSSVPAMFQLSDYARAYVGDTEQVSGLSVNSFQSPVIYKVVSEDSLTFNSWSVSVKYQSLSDTKSGDTKPSLTIYPNPARGRAIFVLSNITDKESRIEMYNSQGIRVYSTSFENASFVSEEIDLTGFTPGIYIIKCSSVKKPVRFIIN